MSVNKNVFASKPERRNFYKLTQTWGDKYSVYHNLPFLNVFGIDDLVDADRPELDQSLDIEPADFDRLKKTSIDLTLCDETDLPILCIEFDGMQQGFNVGTTYYPERVRRQPSIWRRKITELKLKVALGSEFPFFVLGSKYFEDLRPHLRLTIVDGIVGDVLASRAAHARFQGGFQPDEMGFNSDHFEALSQAEQHEIVQDWAIGVEVEESLRHNPIAKRAAQLEWELRDSIRSKEIHPLSYPSFDHIHSIQERNQAFQGVILHGTRVIYHTKHAGDIESEIWLPNFQVMGSTPISLAEEIAELIALDKISKTLPKGR